MNNNDFKGLLDISVELLSSSHFFDQLLHYYSILIISITRGYFNVEIAAKYNTFYHSRTSWASFEFLVLTFDFMHQTSPV